MNEYGVPPEIMRSLKAGLSPRQRPAFLKIKPWEERTPRARGKLATSVRSFQAWRRAQGELLPSDPWSALPPTLQRLGEYLQTLQGRSPSWRTYSTQGLRVYLCTSAGRSWRTWYGCRGTRKMRDGLAPFVGQRQRFAATIDRIGVEDVWRSAITVLLKDVELADTGDVVAD